MPKATNTTKPTSKPRTSSPKAAPGSALSPAAHQAVASFIAAVQRNPAAALVALGALALGVLLIFG